jgi:glutamate carboxypeptidase
MLHTAPVLQWIESQEDSMIQLTKKWVHINSWSDNNNGLACMLDALVEDFASLKGTIQAHTLPNYRVLEKSGTHKEKSLGKALSIKKKGQAPFQILFAGHMDTVYPPQHSFQDVTQQGERLTGPGVADMKGGLAIMLKTVEALERSSFSSSIGWEILINPDEEIGSPGSYWLFKEAAQRNQLGLIFEPSFADGTFVSKRKGSANYTLAIEGQAAHAGRDFHLGRSAIYALAYFMHELEKIQIPGLTINVGIIEGGEALNIVPHQALCRFNIRAETAEAMQLIKKEIEQLVMTCQLRDGIQLTLSEDSWRLPKLLDAKTENLFKVLQSCAHRLDIPFHLKESGGVCDGNILSGEGLPTLDSLGAVGGNIHTQEEYLLLPSLVQRAKLATLLVLTLANNQEAVCHLN